MQISHRKVQILNVIVGNTDQPALNLDDHQLFEYFFSLKTVLNKSLPEDCKK